VAKNESRRRGRSALLTGACVVAIGVGSVLTATTGAFAADEVWDQAQLLASCEEYTDLYGRADNCRFEAMTYEPFTGNMEQVSGVDKNCGEGELRHDVSWSQTTTESNSIEVSATVGASLSKIISAEVSTTYGHTWEHSKTTQDTVSITVPPKSAATLFRGAPMAKVTGRMVINFGSRRQGHYEWYAYPTMTVPAEDQPKLARFTSSTRPLSPEELASCPSVPQGIRVAGSPEAFVPPPAETVIQEPEKAAPQFRGSLNTSEHVAADA
jgi:hypothetical protein